MNHKNHIFVFSGNLSLTIDRKIAAWRENFITKHGEFAASGVALDTTEPNLLARELKAAPFLAEARLVIVRGAHKVAAEYITREYWADIFMGIPSTNFVVFYSIDELPELSKILEQEATIKDFSIANLSEAIAYIATELPNLNQSAVSKIATTLLQDIPRLQTEVAKLALLSYLTSAEALQNCHLRSEKDIFKSLDALLAGNPAEAISLLQVAAGGNEFELLSELTRALRKPSLYTALLLAGYRTQSAQIATGIKDYPAKKYATGSKQRKQALVTLYLELCHLDVGSKTGALSSTETPL